MAEEQPKEIKDIDTENQKKSCPICHSNLFFKLSGLRREQGYTCAKRCEWCGYEEDADGKPLL